MANQLQTKTLILTLTPYHPSTSKTITKAPIMQALHKVTTNKILVTAIASLMLSTGYATSQEMVMTPEEQAQAAAAAEAARNRQTSLSAGMLNTPVAVVSNPPAPLPENIPAPVIPAAVVSNPPAPLPATLPAPVIPAAVVSNPPAPLPATLPAPAIPAAVVSNPPAPLPENIPAPAIPAAVVSNPPAPLPATLPAPVIPAAVVSNPPAELALLGDMTAPMMSTMPLTNPAPVAPMPCEDDMLKEQAAMLVMHLLNHPGKPIKHLNITPALFPKVLKLALEAQTSIDTLVAKQALSHMTSMLEEAQRHRSESTDAKAIWSALENPHYARQKFLAQAIENGNEKFIKFSAQKIIQDLAPGAINEMQVQAVISAAKGAAVSKESGMNSRRVAKQKNMPSEAMMGGTNEEQKHNPQMTCVLPQNFAALLPAGCVAYSVNYYGNDGVNNFSHININGQLQPLHTGKNFANGQIKWSITYGCPVANANPQAAGMPMSSFQVDTLNDLSCDQQGLKQNQSVISSFSLVNNQLVANTTAQAPVVAAPIMQAPVASVVPISGGMPDRFAPPASVAQSAPASAAVIAASANQQVPQQ